MRSMTESEARLLLCAAIKEPVLIITVSEDTAMMIKNSILELAKQILWKNLCRQDYRYKILIRGYECITVMPLSRWKNEKYRLLHKGAVITTSRQIKNIPLTVKEPVLLDDYFKKAEE